MNFQLLLFPDAEQPNKSIEDFLGVPGLVYHKDLLSAKEQQLLLNEIDHQPWRDDLKRRVQHYGYRYDYKARRVDPTMFLGTLPPFLQFLADRLSKLRLLPEVPDQAIINEYLPGQGISPHVDCEPCFGSAIATISLGAVYVMDLTDTMTDACEAIRLELGSCLVFSKEARYRWKHGIKPRFTDNGISRGVEYQLPSER